MAKRRNVDGIAALERELNPVLLGMRAQKRLDHFEVLCARRHTPHRDLHAFFKVASGLQSGQRQGDSTVQFDLNFRELLTEREQKAQIGERTFRSVAVLRGPA